MVKKFEFLEHTADIKFKAYGGTLPRVFENIASAMSEYMAEGKKVKNVICTTLELEAKDMESLLYSFIDEIIFLLDSESFIVHKAHVAIKGKKLSAVIYGDNAKNYTIRNIKAATYAEMEIKKSLKGWQAQVVLDV